jgi:hypothetical protein
VPPRTDPEPEIGHFAQGAAFDEVLLALARGNPGAEVLRDRDH